MTFPTEIKLHITVYLFFSFFNYLSILLQLIKMGSQLFAQTQSSSHNPLANILSSSNCQNKQNLDLKINEDDQWNNGEENVDDDIQQLSVAFNKILKTQEATALNIFKEVGLEQRRQKSSHFIQKKKGKKKLIKSNEERRDKRNSSINVQKTESDQNKQYKILYHQFIKIKKEPIEKEYELKQKIAQGESSSIYRAIHLKTQEVRAIKIIKLNKEMMEEELQKIQNQIQIYKDLDHISIANLYEIFFYRWKYYLVMEYCQGGNLLNNLKHFQYNKNERQIISIMRQILSCMSYLHSKKIAYKNMKLKNIMFLHPYEEGMKLKVKIIDFGSTLKQTTKTNFHLQLYQNDIWNCGLIFYFLLKGNMPTKIKSKSNFGLNLNLSSSQWKNVGEQAKQLLSSLLQKKPIKRLSAKNALNHPFISNGRLKNSSRVLQRDNMKNLVQNMENGLHLNNFVKLIKAFLSTQKSETQFREKLAIIFDKIDKDGSGMIEKDELSDLYFLVSRQFEEKKDPQEIQEILISLDLNKSGKIDFNQFLTAMIDWNILKNDQALQEAFKFLDQDRSGYIERKNLISALKGEKESEIEKIMKEIDENGDFRISKQEFKDYMNGLNL